MYSKSIVIETIFIKAKMNTKWNVNFLKNILLFHSGSHTYSIEFLIDQSTSEIWHFLKPFCLISFYFLDIFKFYSRKEKRKSCNQLGQVSMGSTELAKFCLSPKNCWLKNIEIDDQNYWELALSYQDKV